MSPSRLLFSADPTGTGTGNWELYSSDGTNTGLLKEIRSGADGSLPREFVATLYVATVFRAEGDTTGIELWTTDGTTSGTQMVADINPTGPEQPDLTVSHSPGIPTITICVTDGQPGARASLLLGTPTTSTSTPNVVGTLRVNPISTVELGTLDPNGRACVTVPLPMPWPVGQLGVQGLYQDLSGSSFFLTDLTGVSLSYTVLPAGETIKTVGHFSDDTRHYRTSLETSGFNGGSGYFGLYRIDKGGNRWLVDTWPYTGTPDWTNVLFQGEVAQPPVEQIELLFFDKLPTATGTGGTVVWRSYC